MNLDLTEKLKLWDGIHIEFVEKLYNENVESSDFFEVLISVIINYKDLQKSATWLIKHHFDKGQILPPSLTEKLITTSKILDNWEARLHLLQILPYLNLTESSIIIAEDFVRICLTDNNKFVRAWAYNGLYVLTKYIPELKTELKFICERAMKTESASIKSKVKKILINIDKEETK